MDFKKKPILGMLHMYGGEQASSYADKEIEIFEKEGVDGLGRMFPEILDQYMELSTTDSLPSLKIIAPVETRQADPFYQKTGNRTY